MSCYFFQSHPRQFLKKTRLYPPTSLTNAYKLVKKGKTSVRKAAALHGVRETTLLDRILGSVDINIISAGQPPLFNSSEEKDLAYHFKSMAEYGYGYSRQECVDIATDFALIFGKRTKDKPLTIKWSRFFFCEGGLNLKVLKPRSLEHSRARSATKANVESYFANLSDTMKAHG